MPVGTACLLAFFASPALTASAQSEAAASPRIEEVVVLGSRAAPRAAVDTAVAVDVFRAEEINSVYSSDMVDVIGSLVPSFNVSRQPISDGASFIRPVNLRGLDSHHALVLVNGKRRHRSALLQLGGFGSHGPDVGSIPSSAIESVEVLRDGAAAQYGSDAIAGVINFNLKRNREGFELGGRLGEYDAGDGREVTFDANLGLPLGQNGFVSISAQYSDADATSRSVPYNLTIAQSGQTPRDALANEMTVDGLTFFGPDALTYVRNPDGSVQNVLLGSDGIPDDLDTRFRDNFGTINGSGPFSDVEQPWGQPQREQYMLFVNAALPVSDTAEIYGFGNYSVKDQVGGFFHRTRGVTQLLPLRLEDGSIYNPGQDLYPSGFTPQFGGDVTDFSATAGLRGDFSNGLSYDMSAAYASNEIDYSIVNTLNPSMGPDSPTAFRPGKLVNEEISLNLDFVYEIDLDLASPLSVAFGAEYREETYDIKRGDDASFTIGPFAQPDPFGFCEVNICPEGDPAFNAVPVGSNGFPGFSPGFTSSVGRESYAAYIDLEADITPEWLLNGAARFEDFSDFGSVAIWKLATRYRLTENVNIRGSLGTGFRAPTMGQVSTTNVSTRIAPDGLPIAEGVFPATAPASALFGAEALDNEDSFSYTLGITATPLDGLTLTLDYYYIELDDRIVLSSSFSVGPDEVAALEALGVPGANTIGRVRFFTNDVDTETSGVDLVANYVFDNAYGVTTLSAAFNRNKTRITNRGDFISDQDQFNRENSQPKFRGNVSARHAWNSFDVAARVHYYGEYTRGENGALTNVQKFGREMFVDLEGTWNFDQNYSFTLGAQNLFDNFPDRSEFQCCGRAYDSASVMPWQGAFYFLRANASF